MDAIALDGNVSLRNNVALPRIGFGVYQAPPGAVTRQAVLDALSVGYAHVDTARIYGNEADVGAAIRESGLPRERVFVTTKLWNSDHGYDAALRAFEGSMQRLGLEQLDLYLLHWPVPGLRKESWRALETLYEQGRVRAIGVSNFMVHHLEELLASARVEPMVNQIEVTPFLQQSEVRAFCKRHQIVVEAYSPLTQGERLGDPVLARIAKKHARSPAQILLRWGLEQELVVLPKSVQRARMEENLRVLDFALDADDHEALARLEEGLVTGWDPRNAR